MTDMRNLLYLFFFVVKKKLWEFFSLSLINYPHVWDIGLEESNCKKKCWWWWRKKFLKLKECKQIKSAPLYGVINTTGCAWIKLITMRLSFFFILARDLSARKSIYLPHILKYLSSLESSETGWNEKEAKKQRMERVLQGTKYLPECLREILFTESRL
jgi:hypothetical protein